MRCSIAIICVGKQYKTIRKCLCPCLSMLLIYVTYGVCILRYSPSPRSSLNYVGNYTRKLLLIVFFIINFTSFSNSCQHGPSLTMHYQTLHHRYSPVIDVIVPFNFIVPVILFHYSKLILFCVRNLYSSSAYNCIL